MAYLREQWALTQFFRCRAIVVDGDLRPNTHRNDYPLLLKTRQSWQVC